MKQALTMPALSDTMNNGRLAKWLKQPGDPVKTGEAIAEVETDKAIMEVEAFHDGFLAGPLAPIDTELPIGDTIGYIADTAAEAKTDLAAGKTAVKAAAGQATVAVPPKQEPMPAAASAGETASSPILAAAQANRAMGDGRHRHQHAQPAPASPQPQSALKPEGRDQARPIEIAAGPAPAVLLDGPPFTIARASSLRESVARNMIAAAATPTFHVTAQLPLGGLATLAKEKGISLSLVLARACARAIKAHPLLNSAYTDAGLARRERIDIGIAVDSPDGLITPVLRDVAGRTLAALGADWQSLKEKVKTRRLKPSDYRGATFYISDLGVFPIVESFDSIVPSGASAILSLGAMKVDGALCTLACDHRVVFGADAARFLQTLAEVIEAPAKLFEEDKNS